MHFNERMCKIKHNMNVDTGHITMTSIFTIHKPHATCDHMQHISSLSNITCNLCDNTDLFAIVFCFFVFVAKFQFIKTMLETPAFSYTLIFYLMEIWFLQDVDGFIVLFIHFNFNSNPIQSSVTNNSHLLMGQIVAILWLINRRRFRVYHVPVILSNRDQNKN